jgi:hypothetical protein
MALNDQVKNINPLTEVQFKFEIVDFPATTFFVQTVNLPGVAFDPTPIGRPMRTDVNIMAGAVSYEPLEVTFVVDEYLKNWLEMFNWVTGAQPHYTNAVLTILSSSMNPTLEVHFENTFPTNLTEIAFDSTVSETTSLISTVTFNYSVYTIKNLLNN